jgi:sulfide:quinone oxidoreductase
VLIIGGGVAGLGALLALRRVAAERLELELIAPGRSVAPAFGARWMNDTVTAVNTSSNTVTLASGAARGYDELLVAVGARAEESIPGAVTFGARGGSARFRKVIWAAEAGEVVDLVFAVPAYVGWPLELYELTMLTAQRLRAASVGARVSLVSPEPEPLADYGPPASAAVAEELENRGIQFIGGVLAEEVVWGELRAQPGHVRINADVMITLPRVRGRAISGLPADKDGFIPVDAHGRVEGTTNVYAAGDAINFPVKHDDLASQQAEAAAEAIAARVGIRLTPAPFRPVLGGRVLADVAQPAD